VCVCVLMCCLCVCARANVACVCLCGVCFMWCVCVCFLYGKKVYAHNTSNNRKELMRLQLQHNSEYCDSRVIVK